MNIFKTTMAATLILLTAGCADSKFRVLDTDAASLEGDVQLASGNRSPAALETEAPRGSTVLTTPATGTPATPVTTNSTSTSTSETNRPTVVVTSPAPETVTTTTPAASLSCSNAFETGYMCAGGKGRVLNAGASAEAQCRAFCESQNAGCCGLGRTNVNTGKVYCHAGADARVRYANNYAQLFPHLVASGRQTEIKALNCQGVRANTFTWGTAATVSKDCLKNFDFRLYGEVPANADVLAYTRGDVGQLELHWHQHGNVEGRDLNRNWAAVRKIFNVDQYLAEQPDVLLAGVHPWSHYQSCGSYEGRDFAR